MRICTRFLTGVSAIILVLIASASVHAVPSFGTPSPTKANGTFIAGSGIPANDFTLDTAATGEQVALKARDRATGQPISQVLNTYVVSSGNDPGNPARTAWQVDMQFSPGAGSTATPGTYTYEVRYDIDPFLTTNFVTISVPSVVNGAPMGDSLLLNPGGGAWSDNTTPFVLSNSENYKFSFIAGPGFANLPTGHYEIDATMRLASTGALVASSTIFVQAVPEPASLSALGLLTSAVVMRRRSR